MAEPVVTFNSSTGSDTAASGAGPTTALTGTGGVTASSTSVDLSADSPDLSGVATDGSAVLWVKTSSGRQFSKITNVNNTTKIVTVNTAYTTSESGRTWAIGGKRATWNNADSRTLFGTVGAESLWTIVTETDQTITSTALSLGTGANSIIKGDSESTRRVINQTANASVITQASTGGPHVLANLKFTCSNGTKTSSVGLTGASSRYSWIVNCEFGDSTNKLGRAIQTSSSYHYVYSCNIHDCAATTYALAMTNVNSGYFLFNCWIHDNAGAGIQDDANRLLVSNCIIENNAGDGITTTNAKVIWCVANCTIDGNSGDGIDMNTAAAQGGFVSIYNNNITNNGGYGLRFGADVDPYLATFIDYNNFYNNTSGSYLNYSGGAGDTSVDPSYTDRTNSDFSIGTALKAAGWPSVVGQSPTTSYIDIGAAQREEPAGGGGGGPVLRSRILC